MFSFAKGARAVTAALLTAPAVVAAQGSPPSQSATAAPTPPMTVIKVDGRQLRAGAWRYSMQATGSGQTQALSRELTVAQTTLNGAAAWLVADSKHNGPMPVTDSLYLTRNDLTPLRHSLHMGDLSMLVNYAGDSVFGQATVPQGSAKIAAQNVRGSMATGTMFEVYLRTMPLQTGWKANMAMSAVGPQGNLIIPMSLEVTGEETVTVPAGTFPCYVVTIVGQGTEQRAWVSKTTRDIVKVSASFTQPAAASVESVLISKRP
ncbi:MAG TPA: hypothetical protein VFJ74_04745 [Gemmatimonadaceae bacterium]|nr:hypothetical protein [Gemmatimonadaceae bacterium]